MALQTIGGEIVQLAKETTPGVAGASFFLMPNTTLDIMPQGDDADLYTGSGGNYTNDMTNRRMRSGGGYSGPLCFDEDTVIYDSLMSKVTAVGAGAAKTHAYVPLVRGADTYQSYSLERGKAGAVEPALYGMFNSITVKVSDTTATKSGDMIAQFQNPKTTLTAGGTDMASSPVGTVNWELFWADDLAALAAEANKLTTGFDWEWVYGPKFGMWTPINKVIQSWGGIGQVPVIPSTLSLTTGFDVASTDYAGAGASLNLAKKAAGAMICWRLKGTGSILVAGTPNVYQTYIIDVATKIRNVPNRAALQSILIGQVWPLQVVRDAANAAAVKVTLINATA